MYEITQKIYSKVAERLSEDILNRDFFSGKISFTEQNIEFSLACTLFIRRKKQTTERGTIDAVERLIPVWWEFHTVEGGVELLNDFCFEELASLVEHNL